MVIAKGLRACSQPPCRRRNTTSAVSLAHEPDDIYQPELDALERQPVGQLDRRGLRLVRSPLCLEAQLGLRAGKNANRNRF
jgi:hypothetical protein